LLNGRGIDGVDTFEDVYCEWRRAIDGQSRLTDDDKRNRCENPLFDVVEVMAWRRQGTDGLREAKVKSEEEGRR
jgi:hypothetical protein